MGQLSTLYDWYCGTEVANGIVVFMMLMMATRGSDEQQVQLRTAMMSSGLQRDQRGQLPSLECCLFIHFVPCSFH